ncbi:hypothetical protein [Streptomyces fragilis]|uniref:Integral membrane protein n=1 Tax=Streptomyces fragilis TaxID=67301 RepID=A0ABV2YFB7_9ACTN|nr:hypothetical protein [Streptomyces fragilis]
MTYAPHAPRGSLSRRPPGTWHEGADSRPQADTRLLGDRGTKAMKTVATVGSGLIYGYWAAANTRDGGPITGWNTFYGFMTALAFMLALAAMLALTPRLSRGIRAVAWAAFTGVALGFLVSTTDTSVIRSVVLGGALAVGVFVSALYRIQTRPRPGDARTGDPGYPVTDRQDALRVEEYGQESFTARTAREAVGPAASTAPAAPASPTAPASAGRPADHGTVGHRQLRRRRGGGKVRLLTRRRRMARSIRRHH